MMKITELTKMPIDELTQVLMDKEEELSNLRFQLAIHQLNDTSLIKKIKKDIARIKTLFIEYDLNIRKPVGKK